MKSQKVKYNAYISSGDTGTEMKTLTGINWPEVEATIRTEVLKGRLVTVEMAEPEEVENVRL